MSQEAGPVPDRAEFAGSTEPFRRELLAHCYRMLGSVDDAEDLVQETYLRAWRSYDGFEGRSSVRTWLYQIATNTCLTALEHERRRPLPSGLGGPGQDPGQPPTAGPDITWLQPIPDALVIPESADPAAIVASRESLRLALIASLQYLPPRQRAVLILRDVLAFPAAEVAEMLGTTTGAVKSALQRARARLDEAAPAADQVTEPGEPEARALLDQYIAAFETADAAALERLLRAGRHAGGDAVCGPGSPAAAICVPFLRDQARLAGRLADGADRANGQPAAAAYLRDERRQLPGLRDRRAHRDHHRHRRESSCSPTPACSPRSASRRSCRPGQPGRLGRGPGLERGSGMAFRDDSTDLLDIAIWLRGRQPLMRHPGIAVRSNALRGMGSGGLAGAPVSDSLAALQEAIVTGWVSLDVAARAPVVPADDLVAMLRIQATASRRIVRWRRRPGGGHRRATADWPPDDGRRRGRDRRARMGHR